MKLYETKIIAIRDIDGDGRGLGSSDQRAIAVPFTFPGDVVEAELVRRGKGVIIGELTRIITPSLHRVPPRCPHASESGGCYWQLIEYGEQLRWKRELAQRHFRKAGIEVDIPEVIPSTVLYEFRNKMEYAVGERANSSGSLDNGLGSHQPVIGTKRPGRWWDIVDMDGCLLQSQESGEVIRRIRAYLMKHALVPWNCRTHQGFVRYVVIREGKFTGKRMVVLVTAEGELPAHEELREALSPLVSTMYQGINRTLSDTATAQELKLLYGNPYLEERIGPLTFLIHPLSFFQTNSYMIETLIHIVEEAAGITEETRLLDLYCGLGLFSLTFAPRCAKVMGVEVVPDAIALANRNRDMNVIPHAEFKLNKAEDLTWIGADVDVAIVDPPRAGLHPRVIDALLRFGPRRLVYVCCNPRSFAGEYQELQRAYQILHSTIKCNTQIKILHSAFDN